MIESMDRRAGVGVQRRAAEDAAHICHELLCIGKRFLEFGGVESIMGKLFVSDVVGGCVGT